MEVWFSSDWHYAHANIVKGVSQWESKSACRNFDTLEEHNETLIQNINNCAKKDDIIYMLGDFAFGGKHQIYELRKRLNCNNIHLILGNHDHHIRKNTVLLTDSGEIKAHSLFSSINEVLYKKIGNERFVLCHYSMRTWDNGHHGSIMLYGHSHGSLPDYGASLPTTINDVDGSEIKRMIMPVKFKTMDVGVDTHPEFRPYHIDEIRQMMANRIPLRVDHHEESTN